MIKKERAVLYTRVSTNKEEQKASIENQRAIYTDYCEQNGLELVEIYHDTKSGTNARRKGFQQMMYDAGLDYKPDDVNVDQFVLSGREPKFDVIIVKDTTRFSRNAEIAESVVKRLIDKKVDILFENVNLRASDDKFSLIGSFLFKMGENESAMLGKKVKQTKYFKAKVKQEYNPACLPYGYTWDEDRNKVKVPEQAKVIQFIYDNYHEKGGMKLSKELNEKGIPTQKNHLWSTDKITRIIKNPIYTGTAVVNKTHKQNVTDTKRLQNSEDDFVVIPNAVPSIISKEQYIEANKVRESRINQGGKRRGRKVSYNDIYFQKIKCCCGNSFKKHSTAGSGNKKKINYMCMSRVKGHNCNTRGISLNNLNKGLEETTFNHVVESIKEAVQYKELMKRIEDELVQLEKSRGQLQSQIDQLESQCERFLDKVVSYSDKGEEKLAKGFETKYKKAMQELEALVTQLEEMSVDKLQRLRLKVEQKKELIEQLKHNQSLTNEEKLKLLQKVVVSDYELEYHFTMPNYDDEVQVFNDIFKENPIEIEFQPIQNGITVKRNHKEAREYWEQIVEDYGAREQHERENPYQDEGMQEAQQRLDWEEYDKLRAEGIL